MVLAAHRGLGWGVVSVLFCKSIRLARVKYIWKKISLWLLFCSIRIGGVQVLEYTGRQKGLGAKIIGENIFYYCVAGEGGVRLGIANSLWLRKKKNAIVRCRRGKVSVSTLLI